VLESMFEDIRWISGTFHDAKLYNIQQNNFGGTAIMEIPAGPISLKSDMKFTKSDSNYKINFLTGKLAGSEMNISMSNTSGFDETPNMGTDVSLSFKMEKIPCINLILIKKCGGPDIVMYALDKGMVLLEPKAKILQEQKPELIILPTSTSEEITSSPTEPVIEEIFYEEVKTNPIVIQVEEQFDAQPKKEYFEPVPLIGGEYFFGATIEIDNPDYGYSPTDRVYITVIAPNLNLDPYSPDVIGGDNYSRIIVETDRGSLTNYELIETGDDTSIFVGEVTLVGDAPTKGYGPTQGKLSSYNEDNLEISFELSAPLIDGGYGPFVLFANAEIKSWVGEMEWLNDIYSSSDLATLRVVDDIRNNPDEIDTVSVKVISDSDPEGKIVTLRETAGNSWIFEGQIRFSTSSGGTILVSSGDVITASYVDETLPQEFYKHETLTLSTETKIEGMKLYAPETNPETTPAPPMQEVTSLKINSDKEYYVVGDKVWIEGVALSPTSNVNLKVIDPEGNLVKMFQSNIMRGNQFDATFDIENQFFPLIGSYDIIAWQSSASEDMDVITINVGIKGVDNVKKLGVPAWIKNNAGWWADGQIDDDSFVQGIQFMIKENIISIPNLPESSSDTAETVPAWIKNNAGWWADGQINDDSFVQGIEYLVKVGIIKVS